MQLNRGEGGHKVVPGCCQETWQSEGWGILEEEEEEEGRGRAGGRGEKDSGSLPRGPGCWLLACP